MNEAQRPRDALTNQPVPTGGVLALGNFDGVHLGHRAVVGAAAQKARTLGVHAYALSFEPHPYVFFQKEKRPFRLTSVPTKNKLLKEAGAEDVVTLPFTQETAGLSADEFMDQVLIHGCAVRHVTVGYDFNFGAGRTGDRDTLRQRLEPLGIGVTEVPPYRDQTGQVISSTRIREALAHGNLADVRSMLGRPFVLEGLVQTGDHRGHLIDFPTANMDLGDYLRPLFGVYVIAARRKGDPIRWGGVANIGIRPTIGDNKELLEFHLFDFSGSLYGEPWEVELRHYLRPEKKFDGLEALKAQIQEDAQAARHLLAT